MLVAFAFWNRYHPANTETSVFSLKRKCSIVAFHNMTYIQKTIAMMRFILFGGCKTVFLLLQWMCKRIADVDNDILIHFAA